MSLPFFEQWKCNELKKKSQVKPRKIKIELEQFLRLFPEKNNKKISKTYIRVLTTFITLKKSPIPIRVFTTFITLNNSDLFLSSDLSRERVTAYLTVEVD